MNFRYLIIVLFLLLSNFNTSFSQKIANKQFSLISYDISISNEITDELSDLESYIKAIKVYNTPESDKIKAIFIHNTFYTITDELKKDLKIDILPINAFLTKVKYDNYGYPQTNIQNAIRKGNSPFYFKVQVTIESYTKKYSELNPDQFTDLNYKAIVPKIIIDITVYNKDGVIPVDRWFGEATSIKPLEINEYLLTGFDNKDIELLDDQENPLDNFFFLLHKAIDNVIQDYYTK
ncbi:MAG: hypothetical protein A2W99_03945 [Bacteroidetes bacterium GWF2_33_16]|nr:MAG: hypothetical protein A2X00_07160 [Bacteroidetes bacterium GWE2_32_14]OFY02944.1 MAG: hypothetical protein A2W99_03945 [Bacteroidetes bacterium GWF2_33_16]